jgi:hypothetical protein
LVNVVAGSVLGSTTGWPPALTSDLNADTALWHNTDQYQREVILRIIAAIILVASFAMSGSAFAACPANFALGPDGVCHQNAGLNPCSAGLIFGADGVCHQNADPTPCQARYFLGPDGVCHPA